MNGFSWRWPAALLIGALIIAAVVVIVLALNSKKRLRRGAARLTERSESPKTAQQPAQVWNVASFLGLTPISSHFKAYKIATRSALALVCVALLASLGLAARPSSVNQDASHKTSRNIVLCLDVSGSSLPFDREVIATYLSLVKSFKTERIGMSIFNSTSRTVFPLTDDYSLVTRQLTASMDALKGVQTQEDIDKMSKQQYQAISDWLSGTQNRKDATSLIGDGLVNCAAMVPGFSANGQNSTGQISSSIVFASDNVLSGSPLYSLQQALDLAKENKIHVDGLFTGAVQSENDATTVDMRRRVEAAGGTFSTRSQAGSVGELVRSIESERSRQAERDATTDLIDEPATWVAALMALLAIYFVVMGWVRR